MRVGVQRGGGQRAGGSPHRGEKGGQKRGKIHSSK